MEGEEKKPINGKMGSAACSKFVPLFWVKSLGFLFSPGCGKGFSPSQVLPLQRVLPELPRGGGKMLWLRPCRQASAGVSHA